MLVLGRSLPPSLPLSTVCRNFSQVAWEGVYETSSQPAGVLIGGLSSRSSGTWDTVGVDGEADVSSVS